MPLFECDKCGCVDNTAITNFWTALLEEKPKLCSVCDPEIGKWHRRFERVTASEYEKRYPNARKIEYRRTTSGQPAAGTQQEERKT